MKRRRLIDITFTLLVFLAVSCDTASSVEPLYQEYFVKYYGEDGDHISADMVVNGDNTFTLLGTVLTPAAQRKIFITKVDAQGNQLWQNILGVDNEYPQDIEPLPGGGYAVVSNVLVDELNDYYQFKLLRLDANGIKVDSVQYNVLFDQFARSVTPLSDGGFYVVGYTKESDPKNADASSLPVPELEDPLFVHFDNTLLIANSDEIRLGRSSIGYILKVFENTDGTFTYAASTDELTESEQGGAASDFDVNYIFRRFTFDPDQSAPLYVGDNIKNEFIEYAAKGADGQIYAVGTAEVLTASSILVTKINNSTTTPTRLFSKDFGPGVRVQGVALYPSGGFCYIVANLVDDADGTRDIWLSKINAFDGGQSAFWSAGIAFGTPANDDTASRVYETLTGDVVILATVNITNQKKIAVIKVNREGGFE